MARKSSRRTRATGRAVGKSKAAKKAPRAGVPKKGKKKAKKAKVEVTGYASSVRLSPGTLANPLAPKGSIIWAPGMPGATRSR